MRRDTSTKGTGPLIFDYDRFWKGEIEFSEFLKFFKETSSKIEEIYQKYFSISNNPTFEREN
jgi:hypothetical protein